MDLISLRFRLERTLRDAEGKRFSFVKVANRTGFHSESVRRWLGGDCDPKLVFIMRVCEVYGISANYLLFGTAPIFTQQESHQIIRAKLQEFVHRSLAEFDRALFNAELSVDTVDGTFESEESEMHRSLNTVETPKRTLPEVEVRLARQRATKVIRTGT
jgi:transcriptional regulator with XRE-family HTH domain